MPAIDVSDVSRKLVQLGYLERSSATLGADVVRAITRFQRHASRIYRMPQPDESPGGVFPGRATGVIDDATVIEVDKWIDRRWRLPVGRFELAPLPQGGRLRSDAAQAWAMIVQRVNAAGGTLAGPYGDTTRPMRPNTKTGASHYSFHYSGRAVDINQSLGGGSGQRYFIAQDPMAGSMFWRIYCKTTNQDGAQGKLYAKGGARCFSFTKWQDYDLPGGHYVDLTALIEASAEFERIKAQGQWSGSYNKTEWWHFQYRLNKQETFSDEMELIGHSEADLRRAGWGANAQLDHKPG